jgi:hypothetical protein
MNIIIFSRKYWGKYTFTGNFNYRQKEEVLLLTQKVDSHKLLDIAERLEAMGWPSSEGELVKHSALALSYSEEHEMARWVAHIILDDVAEGRTSRTNDFRIDEKVSSGS